MGKIVIYDVYGRPYNTIIENGVPQIDYYTIFPFFLFKSKWLNPWDLFTGY